MYSFKLRQNKCAFRDGQFYLRKEPINIYLAIFNTLYKNIVP